MLLIYKKVWRMIRNLHFIYKYIYILFLKNKRKNCFAFFMFLYYTKVKKIHLSKIDSFLYLDVLIGEREVGSMAIVTHKHFACTEKEFVSMFFPLLYKNGIRKLSKSELEKKLYYYSLMKEYEDLFQNLSLCPGFQVGDPMISLQNGILDFQKRFLGEDAGTSEDEIVLSSNSFFDMSSYIPYISGDTMQKMQDIARDFGLQYKIECNSPHLFSIYFKNPNDRYDLCDGTWYNDDYCWQLITDGDVKNIRVDEMSNQFFYYESPILPDVELQLHNVTSAAVQIQNATYAVMQGTVNDNVQREKVYTQYLDFQTLKQIQNINMCKCITLTEDTSLIKKYVLR